MDESFSDRKPFHPLCIANTCAIEICFNASRSPTILLHNAPSAVLISDISVLVDDKTHASADNKLKAGRYKPRLLNNRLFRRVCDAICDSPTHLKPSTRVPRKAEERIILSRCPRHVAVCVCWEDASASPGKFYLRWDWYLSRSWHSLTLRVRTRVVLAKDDSLSLTCVSRRVSRITRESLDNTSPNWNWNAKRNIFVQTNVLRSRKIA